MEGRGQGGLCQCQLCAPPSHLDRGAGEQPPRRGQGPLAPCLQDETRHLAARVTLHSYDGFPLFSTSTQDGFVKWGVLPGTGEQTDTVRC